MVVLRAKKKHFGSVVKGNLFIDLKEIGKDSITEEGIHPTNIF